MWDKEEKGKQLETLNKSCNFQRLRNTTHRWCAFFSVASWREDLQRPPSFISGLKCLSGLINGDAAWREAAGRLKKQTLALPIKSDLLDAQADLIKTRPAASRTLWDWQREADWYRQRPPTRHSNVYTRVLLDFSALKWTNECDRISMKAGKTLWPWKTSYNHCYDYYWSVIGRLLCKCNW